MIVLNLSAFVFVVAAAPTANVTQRRDSSREWIERQWEIRYILFVGNGSSIGTRVRLARELNAAPDKAGREKVYLDAEEMFEPTAAFEVAGSERLAAVLIMFDPVGHITSKNARLRAFTAKRSMLGRIVLTFAGSTTKRGYRLAEWSQGIPGDVSFSPAVCTPPDGARYEDGWEKDDYYDGSFGCREWTAQLYDRERPYIDVTSYAKHGSFIGNFVGWSRFADPHKPVIGRQGKTWLCLHDCPVGEQPGVISNITRWAEKHRYPVPTPPPTQPIYPNSNYKDDLGE